MLTEPFPTDSPYADDFARLHTFYSAYIAKHLRDPDEVAEVIAAAATTRRHRLRHPVGADAWLKLALRAALPWPVYERATRRLIGSLP